MPKRRLKDYFLEMKLIDALAIVALAVSLVLLTNSLSPYIAVPKTHIIPVPFISQAPQGLWSEPWQNACEETSILMVQRYYQSPDALPELTPNQAAAQIQNILTIKQRELGQSYDESVATMQALIEHLPNAFNAYVVERPSLNRIKYQLSQNRPVIVPVFAPDLHFPHYAEPSDYHVLVLTGYSDENQMLYLNDPGASKGEQLTIGYETFMNAIHDLQTPNYQAGTPKVLFTAPKQ